VLIVSDQVAIDNAGPDRKQVQGFHDKRKPGSPILSALRIEANPLAVAACNEALSRMLELVQPFITWGR
jgi:hypothetical protein